MILNELQNFVLKYHRVSLAELELHFHMDGDALRQMLKKLVQKGRVRQLPIPEHCDGCTSCNLDTIEFYEWIDGEHDQNQDFSQEGDKTITKAPIHSLQASHDCQKNS